MAVIDMYAEGIKKGWNITNASRLEHDLTVEADVAIIGTGAGGGNNSRNSGKSRTSGGNGGTWTTKIQ